MFPRHPVKTPSRAASPSSNVAVSCNLYSAVVSVLTSFYDFQVARAWLVAVSRPHFEVWRHVQAASTTVQKYLLFLWVGSGLHPSQDIFGWVYECTSVRCMMLKCTIGFGWFCKFESDENLILPCNEPITWITKGWLTLTSQSSPPSHNLPFPWCSVVMPVWHGLGSSRVRCQLFRKLT